MNATAHAVRVEAMEAVRSTLVDGAKALGVSWVDIAKGLKLASSTVVERWTSTREIDGETEPTAPLPLWPLGEPDAIPDGLYYRLIGVIEARRTLRGAGIRGTAEGVGFAVIVNASDTIAELGRALADGKISASEVPGVRALLQRLAAKVETLLRLLDSVERDAGPKLAAVSR
jgi:hypothetical protein